MEKTKKKKTPVQIIVDVFEWILGVFVVLIAAIEIVSISTKNSNYGAPSFFGYQVSTVQTDSMAQDENGNVIYPVGDGIFISKPEFTSLKKGDDIVFYGYYAGSYQLITVHRIIGTGVDATTGDSYYISQGTNTNASIGGHADMKNQVQVIFLKENASSFFTTVRDNHENGSLTLDGTTYTVNAVGAYMGKVIGSSMFVGQFYTAMSQPWAVLLMIVIPCGIIAVSSIVDMIKIKKTPEEELEAAEAKNNGGSANGETSLDSLTSEQKEELKRQMAEQILKEKGDKK